ncbi:hypothetical protein U2P60_06125 [Brucella sp. H1_1004]|uniref:hypothetical protein n=1 Tax=Brucella sp. H1_1004 TaxID=3110109 RepID=UPI0039B378D5
MNKTTKKRAQRYIQESPTVFPFGLGVRRVAKEAVVIDFLDGSEPPIIISSVAMLREQAIKLADGLLEAFEDEDEEK